MCSTFLFWSHYIEYMEQVLFRSGALSGVFGQKLGSNGKMPW